MDLFYPVVPNDRLDPNFKRILDHPASEHAVIQDWANGFVDRDGKFVKEFQTSFNTCFWELYVFACLKQMSLGIDFNYSSPDFTVTTGFFKGTIECVTSQNAAGRRPEHDLTIQEQISDLAGPNRDAISREATIRLANSISGKYQRFCHHYSSLTHVTNKPFILAVAPFQEPYFWVQRLDGITNVLYRSKLAEVTKPNGAVVPLGYFMGPSMADISAVFFSNVATYSKVIAIAKEPGCVDYFVTARHGRAELDHYTKGYDETLLDGLFICHNPFARYPLDMAQFRSHGIAQIYGKSGDICMSIPDGYLLERSCIHLVPKKA